MSIDRLLRESNPPAGMLASPVPQYEDVSTGEPGAVKGRDGAPFSMLLGPDGQPIDPSNPLEVRVRELETELQELRQLLQSGDTKVQLTGSFVKPKLAFSETTVGAGALISLPTISLGERTTSIALTVREANDKDLNVEVRYWFRWPPISGVGSIAFMSREWATLQGFRSDTTPTIDVLGPILEIALRNRSSVSQTYIGILIEREG